MLVRLSTVSDKVSELQLLVDNMGYDLHITRNPELDPDLDEHDGGISNVEWQDYVRDDPSLRLDGFAEAHGPNGETMRVTQAGITVWTEHPTAIPETGLAWLHHDGGEICVKFPDQEFLAKMLSIASDLQAVVVGDDGEEYSAPTDHGILPAADRSVPVATKAWWRFW